MNDWSGQAILQFLAAYMNRPGVALLAFVACAAIACLALLGVVITLRRGAKGKCNWKKDSEQTGDAMTRWVCDTCRSTSFSEGDQPPRTCRAFEPRSKLV